ncbi:MAG TPA: iron ABC transporter permease [Candidatus Brocadiia bacterium]|nr:iron ABC transporter permease [Candidatus Brocadiia bacterium]
MNAVADSANGGFSRFIANHAWKLFLLAVFAFLAAFLVYPLIYCFRAAFVLNGSLSLFHFSTVFSNPKMLGAVWRSLAIATATTVCTFAVTLPAAHLFTRYRFRGKTFLNSLLLLPMIMPPFVGAIGIMQLLSRYGSLNILLVEKLHLLDQGIDLTKMGMWAVVALEVLHLYPIMFLNLAAAMGNVDPTLEDAARNLGDSGFSLFRRVTFPLMMPGFFAGASIVFIWALTDLGTPLILDYPDVLPMYIFRRVSDINDNPGAYALVIFVLVLTGALFYVSNRYAGKRQYAMIVKGGVGSNEKPLGRLGTIAAWLGVGALLLVAVLPHISVILVSIQDKWFMTVLPESVTLRHYRTALGHKLTLPSIRNSMLYSSLSTIVDIVLGVGIAYLLVRKKFAGSRVLDAIVMLPLAIPGLVLAFGYVASYTNTPLDPFVDPTALLVASYAVRRLPYMVRAAYAGFQQVSAGYEEASFNLGASTMRTMRKVTIPLVMANLMAGTILCFSFSMLEVSNSLILAFKEEFFPITRAIYQVMPRLADGPYVASAMGTWAMVFLGLCLMIAATLIGRKMGELFRTAG